jgi:hypothetical protein
MVCQEPHVVSMPARSFITGVAVLFAATGLKDSWYDGSPVDAVVPSHGAMVTSPVYVPVLPNRFEFLNSAAITLP